MDDDDAMIFIAIALAASAFLLSAIAFTAYRGEESKCQRDNNVADCEWVSVPVIQDDGK